MATVTLGGQVTINLSGELPALGTLAPAFTLVGADLSPITLEAFRGRRVVLNIFPSVDTGICSASVRRFNQEASQLDNTVIINVSKDLPFALGRFCGAEGLTDVLTGSDFRGGFDTAYGILQQDGPLAGLLARAVVVVDTEGKVVYTELVPEIKQEPNYEAALAALKA